MGDRKVILVTGASRGIGRALAVAAGSSGYDTVINYRSRETEATRTVEIIQAAGGRALPTRGDVSEPEDVIRVVDQLHAHSSSHRCQDACCGFGRHHLRRTEAGLA